MNWLSQPDETRGFSENREYVHKVKVHKEKACAFSMIHVRAFSLCVSFLSILRIFH